MSRADQLHAHAEQMRMRASLLWLGDEKAQEHAFDLEVEADEIDHLADLPAHDEREEVRS